jgi:hypothetical protein
VAISMKYRPTIRQLTHMISRIDGLLLIVCWLAFVFMPACGPTSKPRVGDIIETWETKNDTFRIRATAYDEKGTHPAPGGGYYLFESSPSGVDRWQKIMTFRHDDPVPIPRNQVRFVNQQVAYLFMGWLYAVTVDGGQSWSVWDASKNNHLSKSYNYDMIREVNISPDGSGKMDLNLTGNKREELSTKDYGAHWTPK